MERLDFRYEISDERLLAYSRVPLLDRLKWLDELRQFTLLVRAAPDVSPGGRKGAEAAAGRGERGR